jgi:phage-related protein
VGHREVQAILWRHSASRGTSTSRESRFERPLLSSIAFSNGKLVATEVNGSVKVMESSGRQGKARRRWRDYRSGSGIRPVHAFIETLTDEEVAEVVAAMKEVAREGMEAARHLRGDVYEVRASTSTRSFRILFASEGAQSQVLLSLVAFVKKTQRTPPRIIDLAEQRLADWRSRARSR